MNKLTGMLLMVVIVLSTSCTHEGYYGDHGPGGWGNMMHYGFGYGGMFMWIIFLIVVGLLVYFIVRSQKANDRISGQGESLLDILKRRYAKGEITKEEFEQMKKDLEA